MQLKCCKNIPVVYNKCFTMGKQEADVMFPFKFMKKVVVLKNNKKRKLALNRNNRGYLKVFGCRKVRMEKGVFVLSFAIG